MFTFKERGLHYIKFNDFYLKESIMFKGERMRMNFPVYFFCPHGSI